MFAVQAAIVFRMHGSARAVSGMLLASLAPGVVMGPWAGVFADRWNPLRTMVTSDVVRAVLIVLLAVSSRLWHICAICFAISGVSAFFVPAQAVVIPAVVEREHLLAASALMQQTLQIARIASPAAAGALVARFGENACYAADAASFAFSAAMLAGMRCHVAPSTCTRGAAQISSAFREGLRCVFSSPLLSFATLSMAAGTFAAGCYSALAAIYVRDILHAGTAVYGAMGSLTAMGTLTGALLMNHAAFGRIAQIGDRKILIAAGMGMVGGCVLLLAAFPAVMVTMIAALGIGVGAGLALVAASAMIKKETPAQLRGRVSSVSFSMMSGAQAAAILVAGSSGFFSGSGRGIRAIYALSGAMLLAQPAYRYFRRGTIRSGPSACFQSPR
jgi:DHA3 family macrolide efflux protein-like MFS transporter